MLARSLPQSLRLHTQSRAFGSNTSEAQHKTNLFEIWLGFLVHIDGEAKAPSAIGLAFQVYVDVGEDNT